MSLDIQKGSPLPLGMTTKINDFVISNEVRDLSKMNHYLNTYFVDNRGGAVYFHENSLVFICRNSLWKTMIVKPPAGSSA